MERSARYALVGLVSVLLFMAGLVFVLWLARFQLTRQYDVYDVDFKGPVNGLSVGGDVYFNGIKVGQVTKLSLDKRDPNRVVARIRTSSDAPVRVDSIGDLEPLGITGVNFIQISAGTVSKPLLKDTVPSNEVPVIRTREGALESLLQGGGDVLTRTVEALDRVNRVLSDQTINNVAATLSDAHAVADELKSQRMILVDLDATLKSVDQTSQHIQTLADTSNQLVSSDGRRSLRSLEAAADEIKATASDTRAALAKIEGPAGAFATTGLPRISSAIESLQTATDSLNRVLAEIEQNPRALVDKPGPKEVSLRP